MFLINPVWHDLGKQEKFSTLGPPRYNITIIRLRAGCQNNSVEVNFHLQKSQLTKF